VRGGPRGMLSHIVLSPAMSAMCPRDTQVGQSGGAHEDLQRGAYRGREDPHVRRDVANPRNFCSLKVYGCAATGGPNGEYSSSLLAHMCPDQPF
jgi:hypothetical protein